MDFRFGVNLLSTTGRDEWRAKSRRAEELGYDVVDVADHLGMPAPFPYLIAAAEATDRPRVGTMVLNAAFYHPAILARDVAGVAEVTGGRLELGLGTGYVRAEFDAAGLTYGTGGQRLDHLARTVAAVAEAAPDVPLLLGGNGNRMLRLAAEHAAIIGFTGMTADNDGVLAMSRADELGERVEFARAAAGGREVELNLLVQTVRPGAEFAELHQRYLPDLTADEFAALPTVLCGSPEEIAEQLRAHRKTFGFSYFTVLEPSLDYFAEVIPLLR